ncbi:MAG: hypothetical protein IKN38_05995 [Clostridia bacterium]|nr:hypothetical protein [Clostridia bacterium]
MLILKGACSIGCAVTVYYCVMRAVNGEKDTLAYVLAAVFALAFTASLFVISSLVSRVDLLEETVRLLGDEDDEEERETALPQKKCPECHAYYDRDEEVCPYCKGNGIAPREDAEYFATEDPDYTGTDFSAEEYVSAYTGVGDDRNGD